MEKVKAQIVIKTKDSRTTATYESGVKTAIAPATPLRTISEAAAFLASQAEPHAGQGYRLVGNKRLGLARWVHPNAVANLHSSWTDVTDMSDEELRRYLADK